MHSLLTKILLIALSIITAIIACSQLNRYNVPLTLEFDHYRIKTFIGVAVFLILLMITALFLISNLVTNILNRLKSYKANYYIAKRKKATSLLMEAALSLSLNASKNAKQIIKNIDTKWLDVTEIEYLSFIESRVQTGNLAVEDLYRLTQNPHLKYLAAQKLAEVEYKLGNFDKALTFAEMYHSFGTLDEGNNYILCNILAKKADWEQVKSITTNLLNNNPLDSKIDKAKFAQVYLDAVDNLLSLEKHEEALHFCEEALLIDPLNKLAANLLCELAASTQNYKLINKVLVGSFRAVPNLNTFLLLRKFTNYSDKELYQLLKGEENNSTYPELFLAISAILSIPVQQNSIISSLENRY